jgi:hypothetical protein
VAPEAAFVSTTVAFAASVASHHGYCMREPGDATPRGSPPPYVRTSQLPWRVAVVLTKCARILTRIECRGLVARGSSGYASGPLVLCFSRTQV